MSKYSLQIECLENIEAFSDEQFTAEMSVIESVLEIFDKTITMMELSNSDINIPNCSMFMESTFFQEDDANTSQPDAQSQSGGETNPAPTDNNTSTGNNTDNQNQKPAMTEEERKAHNKEHWVRQINKKGNVENIFISIITFIPRFLFFIGRCIGKFFKKLFGKDTAEKAKAVANAPQDAKNKAAAEVGEVVDAAAQVNTDNGVDNGNNNNNAVNNNQTNTPGTGSVNIGNGTSKWYDDSIVNAVRGLTNVLKDMNIEYDGSDAKSAEDIIKYVTVFKKMEGQIMNDLPPARQAFEQALTKRADIPVERLQDKINILHTAFKEMNDVTVMLVGKGSGSNDGGGVYGRIINNIQRNVIRHKDNHGNYERSADQRETDNKQLQEAIKPIRNIVKSLKEFATIISEQGVKNIESAYANYSKNIDIAYNALSKYTNGGVNNNNQSQEGGENNGQQKQVNNTQ